jgi:Tfp pilus assembly protein PilF
MHKRFGLARADLKQVVRRAPEVAAAQEYRIIIDKADGPGDIRREALDQALKSSPGNLAVRQAYMVSLLPRWGGSQRAMAAFAREELEAKERYPWLKVLDGMMLEEQGEMACEAGECGKSLEFYDRALQAYDFAPFRARRGVALANLGRDEEALEELCKALSESPTLDWARARRAYLFASHGYPAEAAEDYRKLLQVYPGDADYQAGLRHVTEHLKAVDDAQGAR